MKMLAKCVCDAVGSQDIVTSSMNSTLLLDIREPILYSRSHIKSSINLVLSNLLLRRLQRGSFIITSLLTEDVLQKLSDSACETIILYDECSSTDNLSRGLAVVYSALSKVFPKKFIRFLSGGFAAFQDQYPSHCDNEKHTQQTNPFRISINQTDDSCDPTDRNIFSPDSDMCPVSILPYLYLGNAYHSSQKELLNRLGVSAILNVSRTCPTLFEESFEYKTIPIDDNDRENISSYFDDAIKFIDGVKEKNGKILVHCRAGISRSATICIAYLMRKYAYTLDQAYEYTKKRRATISPNFNFLGQLLTLESEVLAKKQKRELTLPLTAVSLPHSLNGSINNTLCGDSKSKTLSCGPTLKATKHFSYPPQNCKTYPQQSCMSYMGMSAAGKISPTPYRALLTPS